MTCKDCIHSEVCLRCSIAAECFEITNAGIIANSCDDFADRSRFVELPCKVGDTVFFILEDLDELSLKDYDLTVGNSAISQEDTVTEVGGSGFWVRGIYDDGREKTFNPCGDNFVSWEELGENVFLTFAEAEQALKERENNG